MSKGAHFFQKLVNNIAKLKEKKIKNNNQIQTPSTLFSSWLNAFDTMNLHSLYLIYIPLPSHPIVAYLRNLPIAKQLEIMPIE